MTPPNDQQPHCEPMQTNIDTTNVQQSQYEPMRTSIDTTNVQQSHFEPMRTSIGTIKSDAPTKPAGTPPQGAALAGTPPQGAALFVVGTPIGNLGDMTFRAVETLKSVDFIAAEDTRVTAKLLNHFDIQKPMVSYHEHNLRERGEYIVSRIINGENCAIVSDAGMPCISDPGEDLVRLCAENNVSVKIIPGPSAAVSGLAISGLKTSRFTFEGFLSTNKTNRITHLKDIANEYRTMIFYEAPHKLLATLKDLYQQLGDRKISVTRELTKIYEQVIRMSLSEAVEYYTEHTPKGEFVLIIEGKPADVPIVFTLEQAVEIAEKLLNQGVKATDAARQAAKETGFRKSDIYNSLSSLSQE